jgi:hypothetical protein
VRIRTKTLLGTCAAILLGFGPATAQEKAPAPMPAPKGAAPATTPAPAHGQWTPSTCCDTGCCNNCCNGGCYVDAELVFVWPNSDSFDAFTILRGGDHEQHGLDWDVTLTPRITFGWKNCDGQGIRIRFWHFDQDVDETSPAVGTDRVTRLVRDAYLNFSSTPNFSIDTANSEVSDGHFFAVRNDLRIWTLDVEATMDTEVCCTNLTLGAGIRYLNTRSLLQAGHFNANGELQGDSYQIRDEFSAIGPTVSAEARAPFCGVTAIVGLRTSILVTFVDRQVEAADLNGQTFVDNSDSGVWISEIFLGAEKCCDTCYGKISIRGGYEAQYWANTALGTEQGTRLNKGSPVIFDGFSIGVRWEK